MDAEKDSIGAARTQEALLKLNAYIESQKISLQQEISAIQDDEEVERQVKQLTFRKNQLDSDKNNMLVVVDEKIRDCWRLVTEDPRERKEREYMEKMKQEEEEQLAE